MNGAQQVERFTAVRRAEKRLDDLELLLTALAAEVVTDREFIRGAVTQDRAVSDRRHLASTANIDAVRLRSLSLEQRTFWQRLRWFVRGV